MKGFYEKRGSIMSYQAAETRYDAMQYRRSGNSGVKLPAISFGLWHNFGEVDTYKTVAT